MSPEVYARWWAFFHRFSLLQRDSPIFDQIVISALKCMNCPVCQEDALNFYQTLMATVNNPPLANFEKIVRLHNHVNAKLGKPLVGIEQALLHLTDVWTEGRPPTLEAVTIEPGSTPPVADTAITGSSVSLTLLAALSHPTGGSHLDNFLRREVIAEAYFAALVSLAETCDLRHLPDLRDFATAVSLAFLPRTRDGAAPAPVVLQLVPQITVRHMVNLKVYDYYVNLLRSSGLNLPQRNFAHYFPRSQAPMPVQPAGCIPCQQRRR